MNFSNPEKIKHFISSFVGERDIALDLGDMEIDDDMDDYWVNIYRDSFTVDESVAYHPETWDTMIIGIQIIVTRLELGR